MSKRFWPKIFLFLLNSAIPRRHSLANFLAESKNKQDILVMVFFCRAILERQKASIFLSTFCAAGGRKNRMRWINVQSGVPQLRPLHVQPCRNLPAGENVKKYIETQLSDVKPSSHFQKQLAPKTPTIKDPEVRPVICPMEGLEGQTP